MTDLVESAATGAHRMPIPAGKSLLRCQSITKWFGDRVAVDDVSLDVAAATVYGLLGPNGAGKTTTIKMVCGLLDPDAGCVAIASRSTRDDISTRNLVGYVPQDFALYPDLAMAENLEFPGRPYHLKGTPLGCFPDLRSDVSLAAGRFG